MQMLVNIRPSSSWYARARMRVMDSLFPIPRRANVPGYFPLALQCRHACRIPSHLHTVPFQAAAWGPNAACGKCLGNASQRLSADRAVGGDVGQYVHRMPVGLADPRCIGAAGSFGAASTKGWVAQPAALTRVAVSAAVV